MSGIDYFAESAARLVEQHGAGATVKVIDPRAAHDLGDGDVDVNPTSWTAPCTVPITYAPAMVDGERIRATDCVVFLSRGATEAAFAPAPGMLAEVTEYGGSAVQFAVVNVLQHAGAYELQLRGGTD